MEVDDREDMTRVLDASDASTSDTNPPTSARQLPLSSRRSRRI